MSADTPLSSEQSAWIHCEVARPEVFQHVLLRGHTRGDPAMAQYFVIGARSSGNSYWEIDGYGNPVNELKYPPVAWAPIPRFK